MGEVEGRTSDKEITIFKSVGTAVLDLVVAGQIVEKAREKGLGTEIPDKTNQVFRKKGACFFCSYYLQFIADLSLKTNRFGHF